MRPDLWGRWPLLVAAIACVAAAVTILQRLDNGEGSALAALVLVTIVATLLGAFVYAQGHDSHHTEDNDETTR